MTNPPSSYRILQAVATAQSALSRMQSEGVFDADTDAADLLALLGEEGADVAELVRRLVRSIAEAEGLAEAAKARAARITERARRYQRQVDQLRGTTFAILDALPEVFPQRRYKDEECSVRIQAGRQTVWVTDEAAVPDRYAHITRTVQKGAIADDMREGVIVPGAQWTNGPETLVIKRG